MNRSFVIYLAVFIVLSCGSDKKEAEPQKSQNQQNQPDSVIEILDGDTFILSDNRIVRLAMIDTPEELEPLYSDATTALSNLINGKRVSLKPIGSGVDRYGRMLAEAYVDTINVGRRLLYDGLAVLYLYGENKYLLDDYLPAQIRAIDYRLCLWGLPEPSPEDFYINIKGSFRFHRPLCPYIKSSNPARYMEISDRWAALKTGLSPCRYCHP